MLSELEKTDLLIQSYCPSPKMCKEQIVCSRPDMEIRKKIIVQGDYSLVPYEDSRCKIALGDVKCTNKSGDSVIDPDSRIFGGSFDGNVIIGDCDCYIDRDFELVLQRMCCGEVCSVYMMYKDQEGSVVKEITCKIELKEVTEEQLISDWGWMRLFEAATHHKERGVTLVKHKRIVDGFRRFSKALKLVVAIEPVDPLVLDKDTIKQITDMRIKLYNNLAHCQLQFQEYAAAQELCNRALQYDNNNMKALYRRSIARSGLKMYEEAWEDIQRALRIDPSDKASQAKATELKPKIQHINKEYSTVIKKMFG